VTDLEEQIEQEVSKNLRSIESILQEQRARYIRATSEAPPRGEGVTIIACIPAYNEEKAIASVVLRTKKYVDHVIVCDDGSSDMTAGIAEGLGAFVIRHEVNQGKGAALRSAFRQAIKFDPDYVVTLDGDGQHRPEEIPLLIIPLEGDEADMVIGSRYVSGENHEVPYYRRIGHSIIDRVFKRSINDNVNDSQSGFRAYKRKALGLMAETKSNGFGIEAEQISLATRNGYKVREVEAEIQYNGLENTSKQNPLRHGTEIISSILSLIVTERPIEMLATPGIVSVCIGLFSLGLFFYYLNALSYFSIPLAIICTATIIFGTMFILISLVLYAIKDINLRTNN
jgi:glycosyltransferase involved in cell wall biosynthesis